MNKQKTETKTAEQIFCTVVRVEGWIKLQYWHNFMPFYLELPITKRNKHFKMGQKIEMMLLIKKEK